MTYLSAEMQAYYAARTPPFDAVYLKPERKNDLVFLTHHIPTQLADLTVLELACGSGFWTQYIAPHSQRLVATDATAEPLEFAKLRPDTSSVTFLQLDAYRIPPEVGQFSRAFAGLWFSHVPIQARAEFLRSLHARLEPGARVLFLDNSIVQCREHPITETDDQGNTYQHRRLNDGSMHRVLKNFPNATELRDRVEPFATNVTYSGLDNF